MALGRWLGAVVLAVSVALGAPAASRAVEDGLRSKSDTVVIVFDDSGSMKERMRRGGLRRIDAAKKALTTVLQQFPRDATLGIYLLNGARSQGGWLVPMGPVNKVAAVDALRRFEPAGGTPLGESMRVAADALLAERAKKLYGTYRLIVVTDGQASDQAVLDAYLPDILSRGLVVDAIGVDMREDHALATKVHRYRRADDTDALASALVEILAESSNEDPIASEADFELLHALDDLDSAEIVKALATVDNQPVGSVASNAASRGTPPTPGDPYSTGGGGLVNSVPPPAAKPSMIAQFFGALCMCLWPLLFLAIFFFVISARNNRGK